MYVVRKGEKEKFDREKIVETCMRSEIAAKDAKLIAKRVERRIYDGITTKEVYGILSEEMERFETGSGLLFRLREAVAMLDSSSFEVYVKELLERNGYKCRWNMIIPGKCIEHQVDIVATLKTKGRRVNYMVECKRHVNPHRFTGLGACLQVNSRLLDLEEGFNAGKNNINFNSAWVITNSKFSDHAKKYSDCMNIRLTGWKYEKGFELENLIHTKGLYPVTMVAHDARQFLADGIITLDDFLKSSYAKKKAMSDMVEMARDISGHA